MCTQSFNRKKIKSIRRKAVPNKSNLAALFEDSNVLRSELKCTLFQCLFFSYDFITWKELLRKKKR